MMDKEVAWTVFENTGSIDDYLNYIKQLEQDRLKTNRAAKEQGQKQAEFS